MDGMVSYRESSFKRVQGQYGEDGVPGYGREDGI